MWIFSSQKIRHTRVTQITGEPTRECSALAQVNPGGIVLVVDSRSSARNSPLRLLLKRLMDERDRDRAFAHGRRDAFDVAAAHVADRKHARKARFEKMRRPRERPVRGGEVLFRQIRPGFDEAVLVESDTAIEPA